MSQIEQKTVIHKTIPLKMIRIGSFLLQPLSPFPKFLYQSLLLLNNFPNDLVEEIPSDFNYLQENFDYKSKDFRHEILERMG